MILASALQCIAIAEKRSRNGAAMQSSAILCLEEARNLLAPGRCLLAAQWALRSLSYSVGFFSPDYNEVLAITKEGNP